MQKSTRGARRNFYYSFSEDLSLEGICSANTLPAESRLNVNKYKYKYIHILFFCAKFSHLSPLDVLANVYKCHVDLSANRRRNITRLTVYINMYNIYISEVYFIIFCVFFGWMRNPRKCVIIFNLYAISEASFQGGGGNVGIYPYFISKAATDGTDSAWLISIATKI